MNWYKQSDIRSFNDRNAINKRIAEFKKIVMQLEYLAKYVYQNAAHAKVVLKQIRDSKIVSSFAKIKIPLDIAYQTCLDSYNKCSAACKEASDLIYIEMKELEQQRKTFTEEFWPKRVKERTENGKK
jgi:hypothetical protein